MSGYPAAWLDYVVEFHASRDYFECHEILEEHWKATGTEAPDAGVWVGFIQLAVGQYHYRRGNLAGACKMLAGALRQFESEQPAALALMGALGLRREALIRQTQQQLALASSRPPAPYADLNLPIADAALLAACQAEARRRGLQWTAPSDLANAALVHRHTLRDRADVEQARAAAAQVRRQQRRQ